MNHELELWKPVAGFEGLYEVSTHGRVKSFTKKIPIILRQWEHWKGHLFLYLYKTGQKRKKFFAHRLVACAFIPNPDNKPLVNHIDENKKNNHIRNLEWMTDGENTRYYWARKGMTVESNEEF